ncbi:conserved hypothetical protein [Listeria innocua FSL S4-378]|nr:conserved hypothetical protein [Listeria innocua FSL S4-378]
MNAFLNEKTSNINMLSDFISTDTCFVHENNFRFFEVNVSKESAWKSKGMLLL